MPQVIDRLSSNEYLKIIDFSIDKVNMLLYNIYMHKCFNQYF